MQRHWRCRRGFSWWHYGVFVPPRVYIGWYSEPLTPEFKSYWQDFAGDSSLIGFGLARFTSHTAILVPHWFQVVVFVLIAAVPWSPWSRRFSLRTLLIATTLLAVVLGLAVWSAR